MILISSYFIVFWLGESKFWISNQKVLETFWITLRNALRFCACWFGIGFRGNTFLASIEPYFTIGRLFVFTYFGLAVRHLFIWTEHFCTESNLTVLNAASVAAVKPHPAILQLVRLMSRSHFSNCHLYELID